MKTGCKNPGFKYFWWTVVDDGAIKTCDGARPGYMVFRCPAANSAQAARGSKIALIQGWFRR